MLIAIALFFVLVGLFVLSTSFSGLKHKAASLNQKNALITVSRLASSPEFSCENSFGGQRVNCVDSDKLMGLIKNKNVYGDFWGVKSIKIRKIYPNESNIECNFKNYPNCGVFDIYSSGNYSGDKSIFVDLCRKAEKGGGIYNKCTLARIFVGF